MRISPEERAARREAFRRMTLPQKAEHIYTYFKWPIILGIAAVIILGSAVYRLATQRSVVVYTGLINVAAGADLEADLGDGYLAERGLDPRKNEVFFYRDLYLSEDPSAENHEFAYASRMKILATITGQELDLVLLNREAYDILSASGYLLDLSEQFADDPVLRPCLTANAVVLEDNSVDYNLGNDEEYWQVTEEAVNAIDVTALPLFAEAGFDDAVYLGIIGNTPRLVECIRYCEYLAAVE